MTGGEEKQPAVPSRLARRLGFLDAVVVGLGAMLGAGVFAAFAPAAAATGAGLIWGLVLAAGVAWGNATSSAQLAAAYPQSGGTYVYGRQMLGRRWGVLAGWAFVTGKTASGAAMALTFASYLAPSQSRPLAIAAVVAVVALGIGGVQRTARLTRVLGLSSRFRGWVRGSSTGQGGAVAASCQQAEGDQVLGVLEAIGHAGDHS